MSCPVIPDKSASRLKMLVRPMWGSISSKLYAPETETLGRCKSNRLERESDRKVGLSRYSRCSCRVGNLSRGRGASLPATVPAMPEHATTHSPSSSDLTDLLGPLHRPQTLCLDLRRLLGQPYVSICLGHINGGLSRCWTCGWDFLEG